MFNKGVVIVSLGIRVRANEWSPYRFPYGILKHSQQIPYEFEWIPYLILNVIDCKAKHADWIQCPIDAIRAQVGSL